MDKRTENLPILQDFVPYRGRCPKKEKRKKKRKKGEKGKKKEERERKKRKGRKRERKKENKNICFSYLLNTGAPVHLLSFFERARGNLVGAFGAPLDK